MSNSLFDKKEFTVTVLASGLVEGINSLYARTNFEFEMKVAKDGYISRDSALSVAKLKTLMNLADTCRAHGVLREGLAAYTEAVDVMSKLLKAWCDVTVHQLCIEDVEKEEVVL